LSGKTKNIIVTWVIIPVLSSAVAVAVFLLFYGEPEFATAWFRAKNSLFISDDATGYRLRSNLNVFGIAGKQTFHLFTNNLGARVHGPGDSGKIKDGLIVVGGSQAYGHGVENENTFASLVAKRLGITAANFGVSGQGGVGALLMAERFAKANPKFILYGFWVDHYIRNVNICANTSSPVCTELPTVQFKNGDKELYIRRPENPDQTMILNNEWVKEAAAYAAGNDPALIAKWDAIKAKQKSIVDAYHVYPGDGRYQERIYSATKHVLMKMKAISKKHNAILCVIYIPGYSTGSAESADPKLTKIAERHGILLVDMAAAFTRALAAGESIGIPGDGHLSARGHQIIASAVIERLAAHGSMPAELRRKIK